MKKLKLGIVSAALLLAAGGVSTVLSSNGELLKANATSVSDAGELFLTIDSNLPQDSNSFYMTATKGDANILPDDWNNGYAPVSGEGSFKINNVESSYFTVKKTDPGRFYFETSGASAGDELYLGGKWSRIDTSTDTEYQFTFSPAITFTYNGSSWDYVLEDYDRVSLLDAGMPNFEYTAIDNEYGLDNYDNTRLNHFSVNNNTNSYVFEFEVEAKAKEDSQFNLRLGAKTNNWGLDHTIKLNMNGTWGTNGVMEMYEEVEETPTKISDFNINIAPGSKHTLGIGIVKVKNSTGHLLFVESDGAVVGKIFCKLNEREMGTRAAFYYTGSNYAIRNTIEQEYGEEMLTPSSNPDFTDQNYYRYFYTKTDLIPGFNSWIDYAMTYSDTNITLNNNPLFTTGDINYMKKVDATTYFINLPDKSTFKVGDVLTIGGSFKFMQDYSIYHDAEGNVVNRDFTGRTLITPDYVARKMSVKQESFTWTGSKFILKADYDAAKTAAGEVDAQVEAIGEVSVAKKDAINAARTAYDALSDDAKNMVTKLSVLEAAETKLAELQSAFDAAAAELNVINGQKYYPEERGQVNGIRNAAIESMTTATSVDAINAIKNTALEQIAAIKTGAQLRAEEFDAKVTAIGEVTLDKETAITEARTAYTELDDEAKELVTKLSVLEAAETRLAELKQAKADAEAFDAKVTAIGEVTLESEAAITDARNTYEALSDDAKAMVTKLSDLEAAEATLAGLKLDATKTEAKAELDNIDLNAYREAEKATVQGYIAEGKQAIDAAANADEVNTAKGAALDKIATVKTDAELTLEEAKAAAKAELDAIDLSVYRDEQKEQVQSIINLAKETIDQDTTVEGVEETLSGALALIDLVKTDAELTLEEAKAAAKAEITAKYEELTTKNSYSEENSAKLAKAKDDALTAIDAATTVDAVSSAKEAGLTAMNEVPVYVAPKKGCGGSIAATSIILSSLALAGLGLVALKKKRRLIR